MGKLQTPETVQRYQTRLKEELNTNRYVTRFKDRLFEMLHESGKLIKFERLVKIWYRTFWETTTRLSLIHI